MEDCDWFLLDILQHTDCLCFNVSLYHNSSDYFSYIMSVYGQCHVDVSKCTEQNVNNQISQLYCSCFLLF